MNKLNQSSSSLVGETIQKYQTANYEQGFLKVLNEVSNMKNGNELLKLSGISPEQVDLARFTNSFMTNDRTVADLSVDPNSNVSQRSVITYVNEAPKSLFRLNNYYQLWSRLKDTKGIDAANKAVLNDLTGNVYISDFHLWNLPYCYAFSAMEILEQGMPFISKPVSGGAHHVDSFIQHVIQSIMYYSNSIAGAVAFPDFFAALWFVYQHDKKVGYPTSDPVKFEKWVKQQFQLLTFTINQPYRSGTQSPYVNLSVFDKGFSEHLFDDLVWMDPDDNVVEADLAGIDYLQKLYSEWFVEASKTQLFTFPVMTANLVADNLDDDGNETSDRHIYDQDFFKWVAGVTKDRALFNIYSGGRGAISTCCLGSNESIVINGSTEMTMKDLWNNYASNPSTEGFIIPNTKIKVYGVNPVTHEIKLTPVVRLLRKRYNKLLKVTLANDMSFIADDTHRVVRFDDMEHDIPVTELEVNDLVPIRNNDGKLAVSSVVRIEEVTQDDPYVYDVELKSDHLFVHSGGVVTHNCRLRNDTSRYYFNSFGSGGVKIGSHRVCTLNLPRFAYLAEGNWDKFLEIVEDKVHIAHTVLRAHRDTIQAEIDNHLLPLYTLGLMDLDTQFSTVGIIGMYEALAELGYDLCDGDTAMKKATQLSELINSLNDKVSFEEEVMYNMEQIPGESAAIKLATKDKLVYDFDKYPLYSNQFIPLSKQVPMAQRIRVQGALDSQMSGGAILHINLSDKVQSIDMLMTLMDYAIKSGCIYFCPNYNIQKCENGHISVGSTGVCPDCGGKIVENYTRVVGYYTPVSTWKEERRGTDDYESRLWM